MTKVRNTFPTFGINFFNHKLVPPMQKLFAKPITLWGELNPGSLLKEP
jgi:hypothetical protein